MSATQPAQPKVTEREARQVAEAAREQDWRKPSFAKELFLGRFRLDLIHPHPLPADEASAWLTARGVEGGPAGSRILASLYAEVEGFDTGELRASVGFAG